MDGNPRLRLALAYGAICVIWGSTYLAIKVGLESFRPLFYAGVRYLIATVLGLGVLRWLGVPLGGPLRRWLPAFGVGVLFVGVCNGLVFWAETRLDSGYTALLMTASPLGTAILTPLARGERRLGGLGWLGLGVGLAGTTLLLRPWEVEPFELVGAFAVLLSVVVWSATSLWVRRMRQDFHPFALTVVQMGAGSAVLLLAAAVDGHARSGPLTPRALVSLGFLVVFGSLVAFGAYFFLLRHWTATRVATSTYVNPLVAVVLGSIVLHEVVTWKVALGAIVVLIGVTLVLCEQSGAPGR